LLPGLAKQQLQGPVIALCLLGVVLARPQYNGEEKSAETLEMTNELREDQSYDFSFSTSNNINREESGISYPGAEPEEGNYVQSGSYEFTHPDGTVSFITFVSDENGFQPEGDNLPKFSGRVDIQDA